MRITTNATLTYISTPETVPYVKNGEQKEFTRQHVILSVKDGEYDQTLECELGRNVKASELTLNAEYEFSIAIQGRGYESKQQQGVKKAFNKLIITSAIQIHEPFQGTLAPEPEQPVGFDDLPF